MSSLEGVRWIFFDVGYTLLDETPAWDERFARISDELGRRGRVVSVRDLWRAFQDACRTFQPKQWQAVCAAFAKDEAETRDLTALGDGWRHELQTVYPGARDTLATLGQHHKIGIIANQSLGTRDRLLNYGLLDSIALVVGSAEAGMHKPDPRIFLEALRQADCPASEAAMVGDRIDNDIRPANLLGMKTVHVCQGGSGSQRPRELSEVATATVETIAEVAALFPVPSPGAPREG